MRAAGGGMGETFRLGWPRKRQHRGRNLPAGSQQFRPNDIQSTSAVRVWVPGNKGLGTQRSVPSLRLSGLVSDKLRHARQVTW